MDKIEVFDNAIIQHGDYNKRIYVLKFPEQGDRNLVKKLTKKAIDNGYSKVIAKVPKSSLNIFLTTGYKVETTIPKFYNGKEDCCFVSKFTDLSRAVFDPKPLKKFNSVLKNYDFNDEKPNKNGFEVRELSLDDAEEITSIYKNVFETYPFPVFDVDYIRKTMKSHVIYFGVFEKGKLLSVSSSEMDVENQNAEMTDFAARHEARGKGLSKILLRVMEEKMKERNIKTLYTMARLNSIPMNKTFMGAGYNYAGTLINNTNISGGIESLNIWYKYI